LQGNQERESCRRVGLARVRRAFMVTVLGLLLGVSTLSPVLAHSNKGSSGSFKFSGEVTGKLKVPSTLDAGGLTACAISPTQGGTDVITWDNAKLNLGKGSKKISFIDLQLQVSKFGHTYSMVPNSQTDTSLGAVFFSDSGAYQWVSTSGTITTSKSGKSGSVSGTLAAGTYHAGTVGIKGSWAGCTKEI
jgi:hypothetical protein